MYRLFGGSNRRAIAATPSANLEQEPKPKRVQDHKIYQYYRCSNERRSG
jgi:hypothetical protein